MAHAVAPEKRPSRAASSVRSCCRAGGANVGGAERWLWGVRTWTGASGVWVYAVVWGFIARRKVQEIDLAVLPFFALARFASSPSAFGSLAVQAIRALATCRIWAAGTTEHHRNCPAASGALRARG
eukprot:TRINITY_DN220_c0_g1_i6.p1 TRINITY_DN220_c0_g1~~TRINITY_DN220_c0_g1_i6.p1  ORF type:complete len:126 (+),score=3.07 TRINITY_DN220_c0_g1_i6:253-630(+)